MNEFGRSTTGTFVNYLTSGTALPIYYTPLPSCIAEIDGIWVLQDGSEIIVDDTSEEL